MKKHQQHWRGKSSSSEQAWHGMKQYGGSINRMA